jgi:hypothetical protein
MECASTWLGDVEMYLCIENGFMAVVGGVWVVCQYQVLFGVGGGDERAFCCSEMVWFSFVMYLMYLPINISLRGEWVGKEEVEEYLYAQTAWSYKEFLAFTHWPSKSHIR